MKKYNNEKNRMQQRRREKHAYLDNREKQQLDEKRANFYKECNDDERQTQNDIETKQQRFIREGDREAKELKENAEHACQLLQNELSSFEGRRNDIEHEFYRELQKIESENLEKRHQIEIDMEKKKKKLQNDKELTKKVVEEYMSKNHDPDVIEVLNLEFAAKLDMISDHANALYPKMAASVQG